MNYKSLIKAKLKHLSFSVSFYKTLLILLFLLKISLRTILVNFELTTARIYLTILPNHLFPKL